MQRKSLTMYGLVMWLSELWKDIIVWQHSALHDQGNNAYNHLIMWTYKIERSNAHVYAALKMHLFIAVFPRTILQYLRTMPTQHRASSDTVKIMCIVHHKPYIAKNQTHLSCDYSCSAWHVFTFDREYPSVRLRWVFATVTYFCCIFLHYWCI